MTRAPSVAIVAAYPGPEEAMHLNEHVARQTYRAVSLIWAESASMPNSQPAPGEVLKKSELATHLLKSEADMVFFWPDQNELKEAALEKMVLALQLAPAFEGMVDDALGGNGLLLRKGAVLFSSIGSWFGPRLDRNETWMEECRKHEMKFYCLPENLGDSPSRFTEKDKEFEQGIFHKPRPRFENYQQVPADPVWPITPEPPDDRSVLFLTSCLPMGGACKFTLDIVTQLKEKGFQVTVATTAFYPNPWLNEFLHVIPGVFILPYLASGIDFPRLIVHLARARRCSRIVLSHSMLAYQLLPYLRQELPDVAFLDYTHIEYEAEWPHGGYAQLSVNRQSMLDRVLVSSEHLREWMMERGADGDLIEVCHTNIDSRQWAPDLKARERERRDLGIHEKTALILYPCRIAEQKRPHLMAAAIAALRDATRAPFIVVVAGDGPLLLPLRESIKELGLTDHFQFLGAVSLQRVAALHNAADIFFLPSQIEGISLALFEAMALESVPVVADVGGQRELVTPDCGYLVPLGKPIEEVTQYVRALKELLENPARRRQKGAACRKRVQEEFHLEGMTSIFIEAMERASQRHRLHKPKLPEASLCRDLAALAIDHLRLSCEGQRLWERHCDLKEHAARQQQMIEKLRQRMGSDRVEPRAT